MATKTLQGKLGTKKPGKFQSIPQPQSADPTIDAISENMLQLTGQRGTGGKKAVLWEDLEELGVASLNGGKSQLKPGFGHGGDGGNTGDGGGTKPPEFETPTQPINVVGHAGFGIATITWDTALYKGHAYTEIFQGATDVFARAIRVGTTPADIFTISTDLDADKYYWIRFVNIAGDRGPINDTDGIHIVSVKDPQYLLDLINTQIPDLDEYITQPELTEELEGVVDVDLFERLQNLLAEGVLENSVTVDQQISEAKVGTATLRATLRNEYHTAVSTDEAIASAIQTVKSEIEDPDGSSLAATIKNTYVTSTTFTTTQAQLKQELQSNIDGVSTKLSTDYYTKAESDHAISQAKTELTSDLNGVKANLTNNYLTKVETNTAISQATQTLQSSIDGVDSKVTTVSNTIANNQGEFEALWGVNASVGDATASIGLVAKTTGAGINDSYFFVKDADFKVLYSDGATNQQAAIFGTIADPNNPSKRVLSIDTTYINAANIKELVTGDIVADSIVAGSEIHTPVLRSPVINQVGSNFYVTSAGIVTMKGANVNGHIDATSGTLNNVHIKSTATIDRVEARSIVGDVARPIIHSFGSQSWKGTSERQIYEYTVPRDNYDRYYMFGAMLFTTGLGARIRWYVNNTLSREQEVTGGLIAGNVTSPDHLVTIPRNTTTVIRFKIKGYSSDSITDIKAGKTVGLVMKK